MPTGGEWTPLKADATRFAKDGPEGPVSPEQLVGQYVRAIGGPSGISGAGSAAGGGSGSGGGSRGGGSGGGGGGRPRGTGSAVRVAGNLGRFLARVGSAGLDTALRDFGLDHLIGQSASEVTAGLLDALAGPASTIDDAAALAALASLKEELLREATTAADVSRLLSATLDSIGLAGILIRYFATYIYERFCRDFYERWTKAVGPATTDARIRSVKSYIDTRLRTRLGSREVARVDWSGEEGGRFVKGVLSDTCKVFGVPT